MNRPVWPGGGRVRASRAELERWIRERRRGWGVLRREGPAGKGLKPLVKNPAYKLGGQVRVSRAELERWIRERRRGVGGIAV
jgi:hypothetical protein